MENNSSILRKVIVTLFVVLCFILQCSVFNSLALGGIIPNLMIILTSSFGFMRGERGNFSAFGTGSGTTAQNVYYRSNKRRNRPVSPWLVRDLSFQRRRP